MKKYSILAISLCIILTAIMSTGCGQKEQNTVPQYQQNPAPVQEAEPVTQDTQKIIPRSIPEQKQVRPQAPRPRQRIIPSSIPKQQTQSTTNNKTNRKIGKNRRIRKGDYSLQEMK